MYYSARKIKHKPYIVFDAVAEGDLDLIHRRLCKGSVNTKGEFIPDKPLQPIAGVLKESKLPVERFGVCIKALDKQGNLVDRPASEMQAAQREYEAEQKIEKINKIDRETQAAIAEGFTYDGQNFSLSQNAQLNWQRLLLLHQNKLFGKSQRISTKDNQTYVLTAANLQAFIQAGQAAIETALEAGRTKKERLSRE